jgi:hypothetical protein
MKVEEKAEETEEVIYRICRVCKQRKPLSEFYRDKSKKLGRVYICKKCRVIIDKKRYELNREYILDQRKQYCCVHKEQISEQAKLYYLKHKERITVRKRKYSQTHREQIRAYKQKYNLEHKEEITEQRRKRKKQIAEYARKYDLNNKEQKVERDKRYRQTERGSFLKRQTNRRRRARARASKTDLTPEQWHRILKNQGYKCNLCHKKFTKDRSATVDHIFPLSKGGDFMSSNVQALCLSCNCSNNDKTMKCFINSWCL